ncbi:MAG: MBL fold metallo-hydrolase [Pseudomonadota bacterium]
MQKLPTPVIFGLIASLALSACGEATSENAPAKDAELMYLGNAGVMITQGETKILFDPLFRNGFGQYQLVPPELREQLFEAEPPFDNIDAVLISHAHDDHFNAVDLIRFHTSHPEALIIAPEQALDTIRATGSVTDDMAARFISIDLEYSDDPIAIPFASLTVEAVRIPHAGGERRRAIENIAFRVTLEDTATVMHLGDADPSAPDFASYTDHWQERATDLALPPYWFFLSPEGETVVSSTLNANSAIGVHVPVIAPTELILGDKPFLNAPGEVRNFETN